jgi:hypothetical protein
MSLDLSVYCKYISSDLVPKIVQRLNEFDMVVEIHPDFKLDQENDSGFVPFKFRLKTPYFEKFRDKDLKSGFEIYFDDFDLQKRKDELKPKHSFFKKLLGKKQQEVEFTTAEIEERLKDCKKVVTFVWRSSDTFELRFASMTSAILAELTNGVCCYHADDIWYNNTDIVEEAFKDALEYEKSIKEKDFVFHEFDEW